ncbi:MAG: DNA polymerase III subunit delta [Thermoanaerobacteraceae bacterium]
MNYTEFINNLKDGKLKNVYLFYGEEKYLLNDALKRLKAKVLNEATEEFNFIIINEISNDKLVDKIINDCETLPLMSEYRLIVVENEEALLKIDDESSAKLIGYLEKELSSKDIKSIIVFIAKDKIDTRRKLYKSIKKIGEVVVFDNLKFEEAVNYFGYFVRKNGKKIKKATAEYLVKLTGTDLFVLYNEALKLSSYSDKEEISIDDIKSVLSYNINYNIFELVNSIGMKQELIALQRLSKILDSGVLPVVVLSMITRQIRIIAKAKINDASDKKNFALNVGIPIFAVDDILKQSRMFSVKEIKEAYNECLKCDKSIKLGEDGKIVLEMLIRNLCNKHKN